MIKVHNGEIKTNESIELPNEKDEGEQRIIIFIECEIWGIAITKTYICAKLWIKSDKGEWFLSIARSRIKMNKLK